MVDSVVKLRRHTGPGGFRCPCCNPYGMSPRKSKKLDNRYLRRKLKQNIEKE